MGMESFVKKIDLNKPRKKEKGYLDDVPISVVSKALKKLKKAQTPKKKK